MTNAARRLDYDSGVRVLDALGDPTRRRIFELVAERPRSVGETAEHVPVSRPAVSQHLRVLKDAGLVRDEAQGTRRVYALDPYGIRALRVYLDRFWDGALDRFKQAAEREQQRVDDASTGAKSTRSRKKGTSK